MASKETDDKTNQKLKNIPEIIQLVNSNDFNGVKSILLNGKAKVNDVDENGMSPLQHAAYKGQLDMCKLLLEYGADVNIDLHDHHYSVLHFASLSGNIELVKLILVSGAKTYHQNSLKRTAAQMAGFVGNHVVVALINNYLPISDVQYFTKPQGLETKPKLAPEAAKPLYNLIMQTNLHPVYIAMTVEKSSILLNHLNDCSQVLKQMSEKEVMRSENVNEVICIKFHFLSYVLKTLDKELNSRKQKEDENSDKKDKLIFEGLIKKWLIGRASDGFEEYLEFYVRDAIKAFPYVDMPLFLQLVRNVTSSPGDYWAVDVLHGVINGQKGFDDAVVCSTCGSENPDAKKCSKCKAVQYCDRTCQRLHWHNHKKFCEKCKVAYEKKKELEEKREKEEEEKQMMNQMNSLMAQDGGRDKFKADIIKNGEKSDS